MQETAVLRRRQRLLGSGHALVRVRAAVERVPAEAVEVRPEAGMIYRRTRHLRPELEPIPRELSSPHKMQCPLDEAPLIL